MKGELKILALDIATTTGYAVIQTHKDHTISLGKYGLIKLEQDNKVLELYAGVAELVASIKPSLVVIEDIYMSRNAKTFKELSQYQAAAILACYQTDPTITIKLVASKSVRVALGIKAKLRKDIKKEVGETVTSYFAEFLDFNRKDKEDINDAIALGVAVVANPSIATTVVEGK